MSTVTIETPTLDGTRVSNKIDVTPDLDRYINYRYFEENKFYAEYDEELEANPGILNIPIVGSLITFAWIHGAGLHVRDLDRRYFESLRSLRAIYDSFYPGVLHGPGLIVDQFHKNEQHGEGVALLYSGGLDSTHALYQLLKRRPRLQRMIYVGGFDYPMENTRIVDTWTRWKKEYSVLAKREGIQFSSIVTNSRSILNEEEVRRSHGHKLPLHFWDSLRHSPLLISLAAPLSIGRFSELAISASRTWRRPPGPRYPYGSTPTSDEAIGWAELTVDHFGRVPRHVKLRGLLEQLRERRITLRVCTKLDLEGWNCSRCHKCGRAIAFMLAEGLDPNEHGFQVDDQTLSRLIETVKRVNWARRGFHWRSWLEDLPPAVDLNLHGIKDFAEWMREFNVSRAR